MTTDAAGGSSRALKTKNLAQAWEAARTRVEAAEAEMVLAKVELVNKTNGLGNMVAPEALVTEDEVVLVWLDEDLLEVSRHSDGSYYAGWRE